MKKLLSIGLKTLLFLALFAGIWQLAHPLSGLNRISLYNFIFPGRERLPFGESPQTAYNFSIGSLDAAFASHKIQKAGRKDGQTLRVIAIGDSSGWGTLLRPEETLCGQLSGRKLADGRTVVCYNLAYPTLSLTKDYMILNRAMDFEPDLILWPMTLESFPAEKQQDNALIRANWEEYCRLFPDNTASSKEGSSGLALWNERREAADWLRLQLYGLMWAGTGIDQDYPADYPAPQLDLSDENTYLGIEGPLPEEALVWDVLEAGAARAGTVPLLLINEPMLISHGENSNIRYNYYYPREAYDSWRQELHTRADENGWHLLDLWNSLDNERFTNSAIHYDAAGAAAITDRVLEEIDNILTNGPS